MLVVDSDTVRRFVQEYLPSHRHRGLRELVVGDFATWLAGDDVIVRFAFNDEGDRQLRCEATALAVIAPRLPVTVPEPTVLAPSAVGHLAVAYPLLPGLSGEQLRPLGPARDAAAAVVADVLARLHAIDSTLIAADLPTWEVDHAARLNSVVDLAPIVVDKAPEAITPPMTTYLDGNVALPTPASRRVLCHTDLKGEHFLLDRRTAAIIGVIDWADIALDDPAVDIGSLAIWLGEAFVRSVANAYRAPDELVARGLFRIRTWILTEFANMLSGPQPLATGPRHTADSLGVLLAAAPVLCRVKATSGDYASSHRFGDRRRDRNEREPQAPMAGDRIGLATVTHDAHPNRRPASFGSGGLAASPDAPGLGRASSSSDRGRLPGCVGAQQLQPCELRVGVSAQTSVARRVVRGLRRGAA